VIPADLSPLWVSLETSTAATALAFVFGVGAAAAMHRYNGRGRGLLDGLLTLPLVLPPTVVGFFLLLIFGRRSAIGQVLEQVGFRIAFSWPGTVIAATVVAFPLMYRATLGAFEQVNPNLLGAARTLGASEWRTFHRVLLPLARPGVMAGLVLTFARALGEFGATLMLAGNIPGKTQTMPVAIFFAADGGDMGRALSWVVLIVILSLATDRRAELLDAAAANGAAACGFPPG
jgi:molybdate transport system permease protein